MTEHDRRILSAKTKPVDDTDALGEYARAHWFCMACGADWRPLQVHHIIGGRGGRSDEPCNVGMCCHYPCHPFCDLARNLGTVLSFKARLGEWSEAAAERLAALHGKTLPDLVPLAGTTWELQWRRNRPELCGGS